MESRMIDFEHELVSVYLIVLALWFCYSEQKSPRLCDFQSYSSQLAALYDCILVLTHKVSMSVRWSGP